MYCVHPLLHVFFFGMHALLFRRIFILRRWQPLRWGVTACPPRATQAASAVAVEDDVVVEAEKTMAASASVEYQDEDRSL